LQSRETKKIKINNTFLLVIGIIFFFFLYLSYNTPLTGDDWTWGTDKGISRLQSFFYGYNGRYLSNIFEILLTRMDILRYLTMAAFSTALICFLGRVININKDDNTPYLLSFILLLAMPANIYSQTFGWTAGFVNYVTSLVFLLGFLALTKNIYSKELPSYPNWLWIAMIPLGLSTQLLVEHVTLFAVLTGIYVVVYSYIKYKQFFLPHITYTISVIIGGMVMFTNKAYINVLSGSDSYRTIKEKTSENVSFINKVYNSYSDDMYQYLFIDSSIIITFIGVMVIIMIFKSSTKTNWLYLLSKMTLLFIIISSVLYLNFFMHILDDNFLGNRTNDFEALLSLCFFIAVTVSIFLFVKDIETIARLLYYLCGVVLLIAPFIFITPYGPRAALASYAFLILMGLELYFVNRNLLNWSNNFLNKLFLCIATVFILFYASIFTMIGHANRERLNFLQSEVEVGKQEICLDELPHSQFLWMSSTKRKHFIKMFKEFHNVPEKINLKFVPYCEKRK